MSDLTTQDSIDDTVRAAFDQLEGVKEAVPTPNEKPAVQETQPEVVAESSAERTRDEMGRFKAKEANTETKETQHSTDTPKPKRNVPTSWKKEYHDHWSSLDEKLQEYLESRENDFHKGIQQYKGRAEQSESIAREFQPYEAMLRSEGMDHPTTIRTLLNTYYQMRYGDPATKARVISSLANIAGVNLQEMSLPGYQPPQADPVVSDLQNRLNQLQQMFATQQQSQQQNEMNSLAREVISFSKDKPHFDTVRDDMAKLLNAGLADDLQDAYDKAVRFNPSTFSAVQTQQPVDTQNQMQKEQEAARQAKQKAVSVTGAPKGKMQTANAPKATIEEEVEQAFNQIMGGQRI